MTLLRGYILISVLRGVGLALVVLVAVVTALDLVAQLNDIGTGSYDLVGAILYVALGTPRTVFSVLPAAALIGSLLALGNLAVHRELIVMRASGISSWQLLFSVGFAGLALAVLMVLLGESLAPSLSAYADEMRTRAMHEDIGVAEGKATWLREGDRIFSLRRHTGDAGYRGGVLLFEQGTVGLYAYGNGSVEYNGVQRLSIRGIPEAGLGYKIWKSAENSPSAMLCDWRCRYAPCMGSITFSIT